MDEAFQHLRSVEQEGFLAEVVNLFIHDADNILNEVAHLLSVPPPLRPPSPSASSCYFVLGGIDFICSLCLTCDSQEPARGELQQGGRTGASAKGVQRQVMTMINHLFPRPIFNSRRRAIQMCLSSACSFCVVCVVVYSRK